jgi:hypothetical protein
VEEDETPVLIVITATRLGRLGYCVIGSAISSGQRADALSALAAGIQQALGGADGDMRAGSYGGGANGERNYFAQSDSTRLRLDFFQKSMGEFKDPHFSVEARNARGKFQSIPGLEHKYFSGGIGSLPPRTLKGC